MRRFENDTFESAFLKSVEIESVIVSAHPFVTFGENLDFDTFKNNTFQNDTFESVWVDAQATFRW